MKTVDNSFGLDKVSWTVESLRRFETSIADLFNSGKITAPVHLSDGNEEGLLEIFKDFKQGDWIFCSWRSHYQALLAGVPEEDVEAEIIAGRSIALCFPEYNFYSSAIVGGQISLAVGVSVSIKMKEGAARVWCFVGDMTSETGMFQTALRYSEKHQLPITFIVEDNGISVLTETRRVWNSGSLRYEETKSPYIRSFKYNSKYPHAGAGKRIQF
jgi:TPP-dependent pyruvate/acetoin dehydrogenase alpha subunit